MSSHKSSKPTKPPNQTPLSRSSSNSLSMIESKQRILSSISKLSDRDTHHIAVEDIEKIIQSLSNDGVSILLNCLYDAVNDPKPAVRKECIRLFTVVCSTHTESSAPHLTKIIANIVKKLKDSDSQVRDTCRDVIGSLAGLYCNGNDGVVSLFAKPLFDVMGDNNKIAQGAASMSLAKMVECSSADKILMSLQKICPKVCKNLSSLNFLAKAALLRVVESLAKVGAIAPQSFEPLLHSIHECLGSSDWATRKAAADALIALSFNTSNITHERATSTVNVLEASKFDKIKPVRESMTEALNLWKKIAGKGDESSDEQHKSSSHDVNTAESSDQSHRKDLHNLHEKSVKDSTSGLSPVDANSKCRGNNISDKAVGILKNKARALTDKELNPEFFQKLERRDSCELPVEVIVPQRYVNHSNSQTVENKEEPHDTNPGGMNLQNGNELFKVKCGSMEREIVNERQTSDSYSDFSRNPCEYEEGFMNSQGNWLTIQRQLSQLERQQNHLMDMLQDFMGGSHDNMVTLENRVRGLERVVEDMARDLCISTTSRRVSNHNVVKYNRFSTTFTPYDNSVASGFNGRSSSWRTDSSNSYDFQTNGRNGQIGRKAWEKVVGPVRFGEGPSARSVWQASKDEATLEAIRVAGDENSNLVVSRAAIKQEIMSGEEALWSNAMEAIGVGDVDSAFAEVLSTGDDTLLVKLMDKSGPVFEQMSNEVAVEVVVAVSQFLVEKELFEMCLYWVQQLADIVLENAHDDFGIPIEVKRGLLVNLHRVSFSFDVPEDWEGSPPDQLLLQLASTWEMDMKFLGK